ncbi:hypothetical protein PbJCM13498_36060 [Prolixibacter bellariivorans]|uniref:TolB N-terminal domain-containing protein n=1 Tax=Prolixibacter bellariivorans TaxID=314319 RepID=A0A5M4B4G9_9BACT|nr:hypothetical protein [Prolixibacter bellariivorans]GET34743.1 hypothetical protein PbJCM13498_36060 [Prolixibacter bellariivorans]
MRFTAIYIIFLMGLLQACSPQVSQQMQEPDMKTPDPALSIVYFPSKLQHSLLNSSWLKKVGKDYATERPVCIVGSIAIPASLGTSPKAVVPVVEAKLAASGLLRVIHGGDRRATLFTTTTLPSESAQLNWAANQKADFLLTGEVIRKSGNGKYKVHYQMKSVPNGKKVWEDSVTINMQ